MPQQYPFSAVVGSDDMALALILSTISPSVGGVLIRGEKGTAKSTMVRALADVLPPIEVYDGDRFSTDPAAGGRTSPDGPFDIDAEISTRPIRLVELPVGATEDRVLGSLDLKKALAEGAAEFEPGLLARAHRGILYVDEVNLLHDHLVDLLLDAAAMGSSTVERDGVSVTHEARFVLIGTMNPEEGELRPQLLDRFGLTVEVAAPRDPDVRVEVVRRRLAFEADPRSFARSFADAERTLTERIVTAQHLIEDVELSERSLRKIAEVCSAFDVDGMRADIVTARAATAHAAWQGRTSVTVSDIRVAARLALPHRRRRAPFDAPGIDEDLLDRLLAEDDPEPDGPDTGESDAAEGDESTEESSAEPGESREDAAAPIDADPSPEESGTTEPDGSSDQTQPHGSQECAPEGSRENVPEDEAGSGPATEESRDGQVFAATKPYATRLFTVRGVGSGQSGRRSRAITDQGRRVGSRMPDGPGGSIHLVDTLRAAAGDVTDRADRRDERLIVSPEHLRLAVKEGRESNLVLFCVDASGSMAARRRMEHVKTAILSLLLDAYQRRDKVGLVTFRGREAHLVLPPTSSVDVAATRLSELATGGRTPLAEGLLRASEVVLNERIRDPRRRTLLVVITDGRATAGSDAVRRSAQMAGHVASLGVETLVVDCETGRFRLELARDLATRLHARYIGLGEVDATALTSEVRTHLVPAERTPSRRSYGEGRGVA